MIVRHFMAVDVLTLSPRVSCLEAYRKLKQKNVRRAPVMGRSRIVGMVSERDLLRVLPGTPMQASTEAGEAGMDVLLENVMARDVKTLHPNDHLDRAAAMMLKHKIGGMPVVDGNKLKGIITESDIFKALWGILSPRRGCSIVFEEPSGIKDEFTDYLRLCQEHGCQIYAMLCYPRSKGRTTYYLGIEGEGTDDLINALRASSCKIMLAEKKARRLTKTEEASWKR